MPDRSKTRTKTLLKGALSPGEKRELAEELRANYEADKLDNVLNMKKHVAEGQRAYKLVVLERSEG